MIGLRLTVPIACWRKGHARELLETEALPPPATCYGALLSLVGEVDRERHRGCRVTAGLLNEPARSLVLRTLWQIKRQGVAQGEGANAGPDFQQLVIGADLILFCDSRDEPDPGAGLEVRVTRAMRDPESVQRFGGWSIGESTHLVNDAQLIDGATPAGECLVFLAQPSGAVTLPVWVDHVGSAGTRYAVGQMERIRVAPDAARVPQIPLARSSDAG